MSSTGRICQTIVISLLLLVLCSSCQESRLFPCASGDKAHEIAGRLGVEPSWKDIVMYLEPSLAPGTSREQVFSILDKVGPYEVREFSVKKGYQWNVYFTDPITRRCLRGYGFVADDQGIITAAGYLDFP